MEGVVVVHLCNPGFSIRSIKFVDLDSREMGVMRWGVGMRVQRLVLVNTINRERWIRGGRTLECFDESLESIMEFSDLGTELGLDVVHFFMNGQNVPIYLVLKASKSNTNFMIGFFLVGGSHEWMRGPRGKFFLK
jgi:predicted regulator of amino acid metabolism with ACT domain